MSDKPTKLPGTLMIHMETPTERIQNALDIPEQVIYLRSYRVRMTDAAAANLVGVLYLDIPGVFNTNKMIDGNVNFTYFPILLEGAAITVRDGLSIPIAMKSYLTETFTPRILQKNGTGFEEIAGLVSATFIFELSYGHSN